jgi:hypothetical protein
MTRRKRNANERREEGKEEARQGRNFSPLCQFSFHFILPSVVLSSGLRHSCTTIKWHCVYQSEDGTGSSAA